MTADNIQAIYPLSPLQQGILFHSISLPRSGVYFEQISGLLQGDLKIEEFATSWQRVVRRHPILRTAFVWKDLEEPLQVVGKSVRMPFSFEDWSELKPADQANSLEDFLESDRQRGFELSRAPLMRVAIMRSSPEAHYFVWSHHHLLLDGWSWPILIQEVFAIYEGLCSGQEPKLDPVRPYENFIGWLQQQDLRAAENFWREDLKGLTSPTRLLLDRNPEKEFDETEAEAEQHIKLSAATTAEIRSVCEQNQLTLNTLSQGAWALILSCYSNQDDVLFGSTVSGRPPSLPGVESMVGLFTNTLPVRATVDPQESVLTWLKESQNHLVQIRQYEYSSLMKIREWSEIPRDVPPFDTVLSCQNYPQEISAEESQGGLGFSNLRWTGPTNYPITVRVHPGTQLGLSMTYYRSRFADESIAQMLKHLALLVVGFSSHLDRTVFDLLEIIDDEEVRNTRVSSIDFGRDHFQFAGS